MEDGGHVLKKLHRLVDGHVKDVGYRFPLESHFQCLTVVALAMAHLAGHHHIWQKVHLYGTVAIAATVLASPAFDIERETARLVTSYLGFGEIDEQRTDVAEHSCVCGRIRPWCTPNG